MTDTVEALARLYDTIGRVSQPVLASLVRTICQTNPSARDIVEAHLLVNEAEVPQPGTPPAVDTDVEESASSNDDDDNDTKEEVKPPTTGPKRMRPRYAVCINCKEEFDVADNTKKSCNYHWGYTEPDYEKFVDHDEDCHGVIDSQFCRKEYPENFVYTCCDRDGLGDPCVTNWHREREYEAPKRQRF